MIDNVIKIAKEAGEIAREGFGKSFEINYKQNETDLVTEYDKKSEKVIIDFISKEFPTHNILAEESGEDKKNSEYTWVIDPIDGTTNFAHGLPMFSVSIGVMKGEEIIAGAVNHVMNNIIYSAEKGGGAWANDRKLKVSGRDNVGHSLLVTGFPYDMAKNDSEIFEKFKIMLRESRAVRRLGSAALDMCYVAEGAFEGFWEVNLNPWDVCAGKLIVQEAGGRVTNYRGEDFVWDAREILATNGKIHNKMIELLG